MPEGRTYGQFCGLARALDVIGDRWSLLIVRELLVRPMRYGELLTGLPGVATNLLAERLRTLEASGVIERRLSDQPKGVVYALTSWGAGLREPVEALIRWSTPLMTSGPREDNFNASWLAVALQALLHDARADHPTTIGLEVADAHLVLRVDAEGPHITIDDEQRPDTTLHAAPELILGLAAGAIDTDQATAAGNVKGDPRKLSAIFPAR